MPCGPDTELLRKDLEFSRRCDSSHLGDVDADEIDQLLCRGSGVSQGKQRIYSYFSEDHTQADRIRFLKDEYGIGGFGYIGYNENHDGRGISFERSENGHRYDKVR